MPGAGHRIVVVLGHPHFYPRFGFSAKLAEPLSSPFGGREAWMALELVPGRLDGVTGWVRYPPPFGAGVQVRPVYRPDRAEWVRMRTALWPDDGEAEHGDEVAAFFATGTFRWSEPLLPWKVFVAERPDGGLCGFVEASIRPYRRGLHDPARGLRGRMVRGPRHAAAGDRQEAGEGGRAVGGGSRVQGDGVRRPPGERRQPRGAQGARLRGVGTPRPLPQAAERLARGGGEPPRPSRLGSGCSAWQGSFAVCKLPTGSPIPPWATTGDLFSVTRTADELSVVCRQEVVPEGVVCERGWRCLRVAGSMPFTLVGVLASLTTPVAKAGVGVFAFSTFDTDYLLVKADEIQKAVAALRAAGHLVDAEGVVP